MEEEKIAKQKPHTSFNRRLSVAKNSERNITTAKINAKNFILQGNMAKGITIIGWDMILKLFKILLLLLIIFCTFIFKIINKLKSKKLLLARL